MTGNRSSNRLINSLSDHDYDLISTGLEEVDLPQGFHLATAGQSFNHVYFPCNGIASVIAVSPKGRRAEAGMVGREGFTPIGGLVRPSEGPFDIVIQVAGHGLRLKLTALHGPVNSSPALRDLLLRYLVAFNHQVAFTALSNASHTIDVRLARWILMSQDRMQSSQIALTHDYLSLMLAVRRPSVTIALHMLEGQRLIRSERALVVVRDRSGLEDYAGDAYGAPEREYRRLMDIDQVKTMPRVGAVAPLI